MRFITVISLLALFPCLLHADKLREAPIANIITEGVPALSYVSGDKSWSGGFYTNGYIAFTEFDANTCFVVMRSSDASLSPSAIATRVRDFIAKRFELPTAKPSSTWQKKVPDGMQEADFGEAFLQTAPQNNSKEGQRCYLSVQVVRRSSSDFGITVQYSTVTK